MALDVKLLRESFKTVESIAPEAINYFYEYMFEHFPDLKVLFEDTNMDTQKKALINALVFIVKNVDNPTGR